MRLCKKITAGHVVQHFNEAGECAIQKFIAGDDVEYETGFGKSRPGEVPLGTESWYQPFDMVQPNQIIYVIVENMPVREDGEYTVEEVICPKLGYITDVLEAEARVNVLNREYAEKNPDADDHESPRSTQI